MNARAVPFAVGACLFLAGVVVQVFLAGLGLFELTDWKTHGNLGWGLELAPPIVLLLAYLARADRRTMGLSLLLMVATFIQPELALARHEAPVLAALHPVNALVVFFLAWLVARASLRALRHIPGPAGTPSPLPRD